MDMLLWTCCYRHAQCKYIFYFFFFSSKHYKHWEKEERKAVSEMWLGLGSFADVDQKERGCQQSRSCDLQGGARNASVAPGMWPHPAHTEHQRDLHKCSRGFCRGRIFFLWINIPHCSLKHIPFTYGYGEGS